MAPPTHPVRPLLPLSPSDALVNTIADLLVASPASARGARKHIARVHNVAKALSNFIELSATTYVSPQSPLVVHLP